MGHLSVLKFAMSGTVTLAPVGLTRQAGFVPRECLDLLTSARRYITYFEADRNSHKGDHHDRQNHSLGCYCTITDLARSIDGSDIAGFEFGFQRSGIGADLLKVTERANLWRKHGVDVRPIYLTSGTLMGQTLSAGDIGLAGFDVTAMLNLGVSGATDIKVISVMINRLEPFFVVRKTINTPNDLKGKTVAISRYGSGSDIITRVILRYWKLDPDKDVRILQSGNTPSRIAALMG